MPSDFKARPTVYKGIKMRSRLEAGFAQWLDSMEVNWDYEPSAFAGPQGQYLPDFRMRNINVCGQPDVTVYVEVKPEVTGYEDRLRLSLAMRVIYASEPESFVVLVEREGGQAKQPQYVPSPSWERNIGPADDITFIPHQWASIGGAHFGQYSLGIADGDLEGELLPWPDGFWKVGR